MGQVIHYKVGQFYYKIVKVLQSVAIITKQGNTSALTLRSSPDHVMTYFTLPSVNQSHLLVSKLSTNTEILIYFVTNLEIWPLGNERYFRLLTLM